MTEDAHRRITEQFTQQASRFEASVLTLANREYLAWMVRHIAPEPADRVLDVAAGTGHLSRALAPHVRQVIALDLTPAMLDQGRRAAELERITNITFEHGLAEALPYPDASFDLVTTRFSVHHFAAPETPIHEMVRVCRPGGRVAVSDLVAPEDAALAVRYNHLERLRDSSHTNALTEAALRQILSRARLNIIRAASREVELNLRHWFDLTDLTAAPRHTILEALQRELTGGEITGMRPLVRDREMMFTQTWVILVGLRQMV